MDDEANIGRPVPLLRFGVPITLLVMGLFFMLTIRGGHHWGGDFSMYIHHALNIVEGQPYGDTGYIYNPDDPVLGPREYPPLAPLLMAPVIAAFGVDIHALKVEMLLFIVGAIVIFYFVIRRQFTAPYVLVTFVAVALTPYMWMFKETVGSDAPFLLVSYAVLLLTLIIGDRHDAGLATWPLAVLLGVLIYIAYGMRTIGIALVPLAFVTDLLRDRKVRLDGIIPVLVFIPLFILHGMLVPGNSSYLDQLARYDFSLIPGRVWDYGRNIYWETFDISTLPIGGDGPELLRLLGKAIFAYLLATGVLGLIAKVRKGISAIEVFLAAFLAMLVLWPFISPRIAAPLIPLLFYYSFAGLAWAADLLAGFEGIRGIVKRFEPLKQTLLIGAAVIIGGYYLVSYAMIDYRLPDSPGPYDADALALWEVIRTETPPDSVLVFRKPRVLALYSDRAASVYHDAGSDAALLSYMESIGTDYAVVDRTLDEDYYLELIEQNGDRFEMVYHNETFTLYVFGGG